MMIAFPKHLSRISTVCKQISELFERRVIAGKRIYIVDDHHKALAAWTLERRKLDHPPNLITIDHHTDTIEAFLRIARTSFPTDAGRSENFRLELIQEVNWRDDGSVVRAIENLRHDEHIDAATCSGILFAAFCIQLSDSGGHPQSRETIAYRSDQQANWPEAPKLSFPTRPFTYIPSPNRVFVVPFDGALEIPGGSGEEDPHASQIIESAYLDDQLARASEMSTCVGLASPESAPFILDIDLDAFHTRRSIEPQNPATLHRLIRGAAAISIATEASCVDELWLDEGGRLSAEQLLSRLMAHITTAVS